MVALIVGLGVVTVAAVVGLLVCLFKSATQRKRFAAIVDVDEEVGRLRTAAIQDAARMRDEGQRLVVEAAAKVAQAQVEGVGVVAAAELQAQRLVVEAATKVAQAQADGVRLVTAAELQAQTIRQGIQAEEAQKTRIEADTARVAAEFTRLNDELREVEGSLEDISFGLYKPHYSFDTPELFKVEMDKVRDRQKEMIRANRAATCAVEWTVGSSRKDGERMQKQYCKLVLRAFNGECDAAVAKVAWNNAPKMEERIRKAFDAINELGQVMTISIASGYRDLKLAELHLEHELEEKKREIADEQRRIRDQMRDEEKAIREAEKAQADAEADEVRFQKALEKAKVELAKTRGAEHARMSDKIAELEHQLTEAKAKAARAKSLAELTRAGYVYIISNIGSFGENVFKIGLTRRLDPMDRVRELGAASVPFGFDVHAMVYSEDAPALETAFHHRFRDRSLNLVNLRKEFFRVELAEIESFAKERGLKIAFTKLAEAREYRESVVMRLAKGSGPTAVSSARAEERSHAIALS
jgi:hypothetical protein